MQVVKDVLDRVGSVLLQSQSLLHTYLDHVLSYSSQRFFFTHHLLTVAILASLGTFFLFFGFLLGSRLFGVAVTGPLL